MERKIIFAFLCILFISCTLYCPLRRFHLVRGLDLQHPP